MYTRNTLHTTYRTTKNNTQEKCKPHVETPQQYIILMYKKIYSLLTSIIGRSILHAVHVR